MKTQKAWDQAAGYRQGWEDGFRRGLQRAVEVVTSDLEDQTALLVLQAESHGQRVGMLDGRLVTYTPGSQNQTDAEAGIVPDPLPGLSEVVPPEGPPE